MEPPQITLMIGRQPVPAAGGRWVYLGQDFLMLRRLEAGLGAERRIAVAERVERAARELAVEWVNWTSAQGAATGFSLIWWMSNLAGHTVSVSAFFLNLCQLQALDEVLGETRDEPLIVICDDWFQLRSIRETLKRRGIGCRRRPGWLACMLSDAGALALRWVARWGKGLTLVVRHQRAARATRFHSHSLEGQPEGKGTILLLTCVDETCMGRDGLFRDRYFPGLSDGLRSEGWKVRTIPWMFNVRRPRREAFEWFRARGDEFLLLEDYVRWWDFFPAMVTVLRSAGLFRGSRLFRGWSVGPLMQRERITDSSMSGRVRPLLYLPALRRWFKQDGRCTVFIQMFENMPHERPAVQAMRRFAPRVLTIGYQHIGGVATEALAYRITPAEWAGGGFPQRIVANSRETADRLRAQGFPVEAVVEGPALRYRYLQGELPPPRAAACGALLVLLPLELEAAAELLLTVMQHESEIQALGLTVKVKAHPMCAPSQLQTAAGVVAWPQDWTWVEGAVQDHFVSAAIVVGYGSALLDAAASAVPFISLRREAGLTGNPLDAWADEFSECGNVARKVFMLRLRELITPDQPNRRAELARRIRCGLGPCTTEAFGAFLPGR